MRWFLVFSVVCMITASANADERYLYKRYDERSGAFLDTSDFVIAELENGMKKFIWDNTNNGQTEITEYILDSQGMCVEWSRTNGAADTKFVVRNDGAKLTIKGVLNGKAVDKIIRYKDHPYYANPKIELMDFIRSGKGKAEFWTLRSDTLTTYKMIAYQKGIEGVSINGITTRSYRVEWGPSIGMLSRYFSRVYWFRESDLIFIKQSGSNRYVRELIQENHS